MEFRDLTKWACLSSGIIVNSREKPPKTMICKMNDLHPEAGELSKIIASLPEILRVLDQSNKALGRLLTVRDSESRGAANRAFTQGHLMLKQVEGE